MLDAGRRRADQHNKHAAKQAGARRANTAALLRPVAAVDDLAERAGGAAGHLPVHPLLAPLLPWSGGLRRGATVAATGGMSLLLALLAGAMSTGGCARVVGLPSLGAVAAAEQGVPLQRLALAPHPGPDWPAVGAALLDGLDLVVAAPAGAVDATSEAMHGQARSRGTATPRHNRVQCLRGGIVAPACCLRRSLVLGGEFVDRYGIDPE
jgi:hypothetical protein